MANASIRFLGGAGTVTGSKFLLEAGRRRFLIDCGLFQGLKELRLQNWADFPVDPRSIHALILTHAHLDHCGALALLVRGGFEGPIYCTPPTADLARLVLTDAARIEEEEAAMARVVDDVAGRRGHLIIPSFAIGRTQELLYLLSQLKRMNRIPDLPIYLDSPMAIQATEIFLSHSTWHKLSPAECRALDSAAVMVRSAQQSEEVLHKRKSSIVIAGSGMLTGGRVLRHLEERVGDRRNCILLTGYQAAGTRGRLLRDGAPEIKMHGEYYPVAAEIREITGLSAHADQKEILRWLRGFKKQPKQTFIVHGEPQASAALKVKMRDTLGWDSHVPQPMEKLELRP